MEPISNKVHDFLNGDQQFTIPIFQRRYDWSKKQCKQLFDDIKMIGESSDENHFLGTIVHLNDKYDVISKYRVIDGQQRLTTIALFISALAKFLYTNDVEGINITAEKLFNRYLVNDEEGELRYKIKLNEPDNKTLHKVIEHTLTKQDMFITSPNDSEKIWKNYKYFLSRINENNAKILYDGFRKLHLIIIRLDEHVDNPQLIFESLNYKGLSLNNSDLIRNYVLMGLKPFQQDKIYDDYWFEMEQLFENLDYSFDKFIKDYLTSQLGKIPVQKELYNEFKRYAQDFILKHPSDDKFEKILALTEDIYKYFKYFEKFYAGETESPDLKLAFENVYEFGQKVINPFFLNLYEDYEKKLLKESEFLEILNITESYLFRRNVCDLNNQNLKTIFAGAYQKLDKDNYYESYKSLILKEEGNRRFPNSTEFGNEFVKLDIYSKSKGITKYALRKLENFGHEKEPTNTEPYTIEHIMPQKEDLSDEWKKELGPDWKRIHDTYLHTIGNLTLTGYNQKLSYLPFQTKRDMENGFKDSSIRLNKYLANLKNWNENQITRRASELRKKAQKIWPYPKVQKRLK